ncbi:MAG: T9SS type A sorting domain-containing protein [Saprospiraceae bacterium]|nr:T9SS type A sorting domain-containing protein [Saprospiraceae bacterium]
MMKYITSILLIFNFNIILLSQNEEGLISREVTKEFRLYDDPSTVEYEYRKLYTYDGNGFLSKLISEQKSLENNWQWLKSWEDSYIYTSKGQIQKSITIRFNVDQSLNSKITTTYLWNDNQLVERTYDIYWSLGHFGYSEKEVFDSHGRKKQRIFTDYNNEGITRDYISNYRYDTNGCLELIEDLHSEYRLSDTLKSRAKQVFIQDESCRPILTEYWTYNYNTELFELKFTDKYEYRKDPKGNIIYESYSQKTEGVDDDFQLIYEVFNTVDEKGNVLLTEDIRQDYKTRVEMAYNDMSLMTEIRYFFWDFQNEVWIPDFESYSKFDQDSNLIENYFYYSFDTITNTFFGSTHNIIQYNENNQKIYEEQQRENLANPNNPIIEHNIARYDYECNGRSVRNTSMELISKRGSETLYFYHDIPSCSDLFSQQQELNVFPNPASEYIHFTINEINEAIAVSIFNIDGALVYQFNNSSGGLISAWINNLENGTYLIKAETSNKTYLGKFIKI